MPVFNCRKTKGLGEVPAIGLVIVTLVFGMIDATSVLYFNFAVPLPVNGNTDPLGVAAN